MRDRDPTVRSRELGDGLREQLRAARLTGKEAAVRLGWSASWVSRLLSGVRRASEVDVAAFLAVCGTTGDERERLLGLAREQHQPSWLQQHGSRLPPQLRTLIDHENEAESITYFQALIVPGMLQTGDYARAVIGAVATVPAEEIEGRVRTRLARNSLFSRTPPIQFAFYLHESVLRAPIGGPVVMADQMRHLERIAARRSVTVRVVASELGAHAGTAGSFTFLEFGRVRPVAYLESETASIFLELPEETGAYRRVIAALDETALSPDASAALIATVATEHDAAAEEDSEHDGP